MNKDDYIDGLLLRAGYLNTLFLTAGSIAILVILYKFQHKKTGEYKGVILNTSQFWILAIIFSFLHFQFGNLFKQSCDNIINISSISKSCDTCLIFKDVKKEAWNSLTYKKAPLIFQGLLPNKNISGKSYFQIDNFSSYMLMGILLTCFFCYHLQKQHKR